MSRWPTEKANRMKRRTTLRGYIADNLCNSIRARHKKKHGTTCTLTTDEVLEIYNRQGGLCYWTKLPMQWGDDLPAQHPLKLSFDQLDPGQGYTKDNLVLATNLANRARGDCPASEWAEILSLLKNTL